MTLGEKLKEARLAAGLSQRQLCGEQITRNMLSQIENGAARPSMDTLQYLANRLGKTVSWFLEGPESAAEAYGRGDWQAVLAGAEDADRLYREFAKLHLAEQMLNAGRQPYALRLLEGWTAKEEAAERQRLLLLARIRPETVALLPSLDDELYLRARWALENQDTDRALALLVAAGEQTASRWRLLRGTVAFRQGEYEEARRCLSDAEAAYPRETAEMLEICCRELGDYQMAYHYACVQRDRM